MYCFICTAFVKLFYLNFSFNDLYLNVFLSMLVSKSITLLNVFNIFGVFSLLVRETLKLNFDL